MARPAADIDGAAAAHGRLARTLAALTDDDARGPSRLPGWTLGHVLTHVARNADSFVGMIEAARGGEVGDQYPGGRRQREGDIEAGAGRPAGALVDDVLEACARLETMWAETDDETWDRGQARAARGPIPIADLPSRRWREVEVHHADLGLAYRCADWPEAYVARDLPLMVGEVAARLPAGTAVVLRATDTGERWTVPEGAVDPVEVAGDRRRLLAWIFGRVDDPSLPQLSSW